MCDYAHQFGAKVYVTVNTIIYDNEIDDTRKLLLQLNEIGVDALLVQDMGVLKLVDELKEPIITKTIKPIIQIIFYHNKF